MHHYGYDGLKNIAIHPSACVSPEATLEPGVCVGPWCVVDAGAHLETGVLLESRVRVYGGVRVGARTRVFDGAVLGADPQDLKYQGEDTRLEIGPDCRVREYCTLHRGTGAGGVTRVGARVLLMAYVHVAHDCVIGDEVVLANRVQLGGHVRVGRGAVVGGNTAVQQWTEIGELSFIGGTLKVERHVPPACRALGNPLRYAGLNLHGLRRRGVTPERVRALERAYRELYRGPTREVVARWRAAGWPDPLLQAFFEDWQGGLIRPEGVEEAESG